MKLTSIMEGVVYATCTFELASMHMSYTQNLPITFNLSSYISILGPK